MLPDEGAGRRIQGIQGTRAAVRGITADVERRAVERRGRNITLSVRRVAAADGDMGLPDRSRRERVPLEGVEDAVLVDHTDKGLSIALR